tara:strand:+ start:807 stop:1502 length:696 start_codon:yes stop_codon:yes gene_type:complete
MKLIGAPLALYKEFSTGAEKAPEVIKKELNLDFPILTLNNLTQEKANKIIKEKAKQIFQSNQKPLFIGGDHSITFPILQSQTNSFDIFWFDAHPDAYDNYKHKLSHATVLRRISELPNCKNIYLIGVRDFAEEEKKFLENSEKVKIISLSRLPNIQSNRYYITIDIDVLDPNTAPSVDHPVPNGLTTKELFNAIKILNQPFGADVVELIPDNGITTKTTVSVIKQLLYNKS